MVNATGYQVWECYDAGADLWRLVAFGITLKAAEADLRMTVRERDSIGCGFFRTQRVRGGLPGNDWCVARGCELAGMEAW